MRPLIFFALLAGKALASGYLTLETSPAGVEVWYSTPGEGQMKYLGDSPLDKRELASGTYDLWLIQGGKDTVAVSGVVIRDNQHTQVTREMPANYASLKVRTDPDSAEIWLDGVKLGNAPYANSLVLPGTYSLKIAPREALYRTRVEKLSVKKGDSLDLNRPLSYRDKSFLEENLSVRPWAVQLEGGYQFGSVFGVFDTAGKGKTFGKSAQRKQNDFPVTLRFGIPFGLELHTQLPFHSYDKKASSAPLPRDVAFGLKYTLRPFGVGLDASYSVGASASGGGFNHDRLLLTLLGIYAKDKILLQGNGGYAFHFTDKDSSNIDPGDALFVNARVGYAAEAFLPYLGVLLNFGLDGNKSGTAPAPDTTLPGGHVISLEPGVAYDFNDLFSLQLGIPFAVLGKNAPKYWALHLSLALRLGIL